MGPDFLYIGCQKAGSRWLYDQLAAHEAFWMPPIKELHYFDGYEAGGGIAHQVRQFKRQRGTLRKLLRLKDPRLQRPGAAAFFDQAKAGDGDKLDLDWYASLFRWKGDRLSGDVTPAYSTLSAGMIGLIAARFPDLRCILFIRDPVARAWSQACEIMRLGQDAVPQDWPEMVSFLTTKRVATRSYPSRIFAQWRDHVPADRIFVGFFDQLASEPDVLRKDVLQFLGAGSSLPRVEAGFDQKRNQVRVPCPPEMQRRLADWFADEMHACATTFGGPAIAWPRRYGLTSKA
jgi:Sulfotransferase family